MDFIDQLRALAERVPQQLEHIQTEEATKNALIMPFINLLGYNVFDPTQVVPEFTADHGTKKGEKVDYAIMRDGTPAILIECKKVGANLAEVHASQLFRYFTVTPARLAILTNGVEYRFYTDLDEANKMDAMPFHRCTILDITDQDVEVLKRFTRTHFEPAELSERAADLKYTNGIKALIAGEFTNPSDEFVRHFTAQVYSGRFTQGVREQFTPRVRKAFREFVKDTVNTRLQSAAIVDDSPEPEPIAEADAPASNDDGIETTAEELEGVAIVKAIVAEVLDPDRVYMRDTKSYCGVLVDDNNRKPLCRLRFNAATVKYVGLFDGDGEDKVQIETLRDLYGLAERLRATARQYVEVGEAV